MSCCNIVVLVAVLVVSWVAFRRNRTRYFTWLWSRSVIGFNHQMDELKEQFFKPLNDMESNNPELRKEKALKILEVGVGSGSNVKFYPKGTRLVTVDPNPHFASYYENNRSQFENIHSKDFIDTTGDKMDMIESNTIDVVVTTVVLCCVDKLGPTIDEIYRVLAPGGKYYLLEHVRETNTEHWVRIFFQQLLTKSGVWRFFTDGCSLTKDILPDIEKAGFTSVEKEYLDPPGQPNLLFRAVAPVVGPMLKAVAVK